MTEKERLRKERLSNMSNILKDVKEEKETKSNYTDLAEELQFISENNQENSEIPEEEFTIEEPIKEEKICNSVLTEDDKESIKKELLNILTSEEIKKVTSNFNTKEEKQAKHKMEFSKKITIACVALAFLFILFICIEMHLQQNLEPVAYVGAGIVIMLGICVKAYMKRAYQKDLVTMKVSQSKELSELKKHYGDDFIYEDIDDISLDGT